MLLWLDLETTGLDPVSDKILEVGVVVTSDDCTNIVAKESWVLHQDRETLDRLMNTTVRDMHTRSGLLTLVEDSDLNLGGVEFRLLQILRQFWPADKKEKPILCGNSVHFDRSFIRQQMPALDKLLHYRHGDASGARELCQKITGRQIGKKTTNHRAMIDCLNSIELARSVFQPEKEIHISLKSLHDLQLFSHNTALDKGFWDHTTGFTFGSILFRLAVSEKLALIGSEVSEALEEWRKPNGGNVDEELADVIIRVCDLASWLNFDLDSVVSKKLEKNKLRPRLHGKRF